MTLDQVREILGRVRYLDWRWRVLPKGDGFLIQAVFIAPDANNGGLFEQRGRKWYVSSHSTLSEVVETAWAAVQRAVLHEARENFYYAGSKLHDPHLDAREMAVAARVARRDTRDFRVE